jgi:Tfp pilus assembly protein PilF
MNRRAILNRPCGIEDHFPTNSRPSRRALKKRLLLSAVCAWLSLAFGFTVVRGQDPARASRAGALVAEGIAAIERSDVAAAQTAFRRALEINPQEVTARTYLGALAERAGRLDEAERHFAAAVTAEPKSAATRNNYGAILLRRGRAAQAAAEFEASLRLNPEQPSALVNLAQIRFSSGRPEDLRAARELFRRAHAITPDAEIARALAVIAVKLGASLFEAGSHEEAAREFGAAVAADPSNLRAVVLLARAHLARKEIAAAGRALESVVASGLTEKAVGGEAAQVFATLAEVYEASGHVENAIPAMRLAIERDAANEFYHFRYGMLLTDTKAPAAAVIRLEEALKKFPRSARLTFALGVAHFAYHKNDEAARAFERALELDPKFAAAAAYLGMTKLEVGDYGAALAAFERALKLDDRLAAAHFLAADVLLKRETAGAAARAEAHFKRAAALDAAFAPARLALGKLYARTNRLAEAVAQLEEVTRLAPELAEARYQLGRAYQRLKRPADASRELAEFKRLSEAQREQAQQGLREITRRLADVRF